MKILFDTNVIIAAFITHGTCNELFKYCLTSKHNLFISQWILNELSEKLQTKFKYSKVRIKEVLNLIKKNFIIIKKCKKLDQPICRDRDDDNVIAAAISAKVNCIITGDLDLLVLKEIENIKIIRPNDFWQFELEY